MKSADRQAALLDYIAPKVRLWRKARDFLVRQRKQVVAPKACFQHDAIRAHLGEFGIVAPKACFQHDAKGIHNVDRLLDTARDVPDAAHPALDMLADQLCATQARIKEVTARISEMQAKDALARRLATVPGVGSISSSAFAATPPRRGCLPQRTRLRGIVLKARLRRDARPDTTGPFQWREREARADTKAGNQYLRRLLYLGASSRRHASGAMAQISARRGHREGASGQAPDWLDRMLARKPVKVVAIALANRMARTIWAFAMDLEPMATHGSLRRGDSYRSTVA